jgi:hypothetical protein
VTTEYRRADAGDFARDGFRAVVVRGSGSASRGLVAMSADLDFLPKSRLNKDEIGIVYLDFDGTSHFQSVKFLHRAKPRLLHYVPGVILRPG